MNKKRLIREAAKEIKQLPINIKQHQQIVSFLKFNRTEEFEKMQKYISRRNKTTKNAEFIMENIIFAVTSIFATDNPVQWIEYNLDVRLIMALMQSTPPKNNS